MRAARLAMNRRITEIRDRSPSRDDVPSILERQSSGG
jgi:hypothetical protein